MTRRLLILSLVCVSGCATTEPNIHVPGNYIATVSSASFTGWYKDLCRNNKLVRELPDCLQIGGEVYKVKLTDIQSSKGLKIPGVLEIGFTGHALSKQYRNRVKLELEHSKKDFREDTGVEYIAKTWSGT